jgi:hypothetical protein
MGVDGGMNPTFLAAVKSHGGPGAPIKTALGTIPAHVNPPAEAPAESPSIASIMSLASADSRPAPAPAAAPRSSVQVASASSGGVGGFFSGLFGSKSEDQATPQPAETASSSRPKAKPAASASKPNATAAARPKSEPQPATKTADAAPKASAPKQETNAPPASNTANVLSGAAPTVPSGGFDGRFGAWQ